MFDPNCIFPTVCIIQWVTAPYPPNVLSLIFSLKAQKFWTSLISPRVLFLYIFEEPRRELEQKCICCVQMKKRGVNDRWMELGLDREMDTFFYLLSCFRNKNAMRIWRVYDKMTWTYIHYRLRLLHRYVEPYFGKWRVLHRDMTLIHGPGLYKSNWGGDAAF